MNPFKGNNTISTFVEFLTGEGLQAEDANDLGVVEIVNPPYPRLEYYGPFVAQLEAGLLAAGFASRGEYNFESSDLRAMLVNVDVDRQEGPPIHVLFCLRDGYMDGILEGIGDRESVPHDYSDTTEKSTELSALAHAGDEALKAMGSSMLKTIVEDALVFRTRQHSGWEEVDNREAQAMLINGEQRSAELTRDGFITFLRTAEGIEFAKKWNQPYFNHAVKFHSRISVAEFKRVDVTAFKALVSYWSGRSGCSESEAEETLVRDADSEYTVSFKTDQDFSKGISDGRSGKYRFGVDFSGETAFYNESTKTWESWGFV